MADTAKFCVVYLDGLEEKRSAWFSSRERATRALAIIRARGHRAVIYRD